MCAVRCYRSLKRDEEITLWRSLCALGAPLYGNLCIFFSPSFPPLPFFFLPPSHPNAISFSLSLRFSFFLVHLVLKILFCGLPLSLCVHLSRCALSSASASSSVSLARSMKHTHQGISPIPSFAPRPFLSSPRLAASSFCLFLSSFLSYFSLTVRAPLPLPLFSLLVYFPLPAGNCTLLLLLARRFSLSSPRIYQCSYSFPCFLFISLSSSTFLLLRSILFSD